MKAEPLHSVSLPISQQPKDRSRSGTNEQAIQACYDLLSSGQPLSEILVALKQLGPLNTRQSEFGGTADKVPISSAVAEIHGALPQCAMTEIAEPVKAGRSLVLLKFEPSQRARDEKKWSRPICLVLFWLVPAMSLMLVGIAGKLLIEGGRLRTSGDANTSAETVALPAITEVGRTASEQPKAASAGEPSLPGSPPEPATQAVGTAPANDQDRGPLIDKSMQNRPTARTLPRATSRSSLVQRPQSQIYPSSPREWGLPRRLTDGF